MKREKYEDYLVDKARELLDANVQTDLEDTKKTPKKLKKKMENDEKPEPRTSYAFDPEAAEFFSRMRNEMDNEELKDFLKGDHEFHGADIEMFSRTEERFILQNHKTMEPEKMAEALDREPDEIRFKMKSFGLKRD